MTTLKHCILSAQQFDETVKFSNLSAPAIEYEWSTVGKVKISHPTLIEFQNNRKFIHPILAGICRNSFINKVEPPLINQHFIDVEIKNIKYPKAFKEKCLHFLKYMYNNGGKDFKKFDFYNARDYPICYSEDLDDFSRVLEYLEDNYQIKWHSAPGMARNLKQYFDVQLTDEGIEKVEAELPNIPMIGLAEQEISTGNPINDEKINHAKTLFFQQPQTMDRMRSSCESLIFILEPLRQEIKKYLNSKDTEDFFNIVNNFDIRHNKEKTKDIEHPEQLEWIFYSLLNSINTYSKLKNRFKS